MVESVPNSSCMQAYDPKRYWEILKVVRSKEGDIPAGHWSSMSAICSVLAAIIYLTVLILAVYSKEWVIFTFVILWAAVGFAKALVKSGEENLLDNWVIRTVTENNFSRADATEFLFDFEWDDVQYSEEHINITHLKENAENAKNQ